MCVFRFFFFFGCCSCFIVFLRTYLALQREEHNSCFRTFFLLFCFTNFRMVLTCLCISMFMSSRLHYQPEVCFFFSSFVHSSHCKIIQQTKKKKKKRFPHSWMSRFWSELSHYGICVHKQSIFLISRCRPLLISYNKALSVHCFQSSS